MNRVAKKHTDQPQRNDLAAQQPEKKRKRRLTPEQLSDMRADLEEYKRLTIERAPYTLTAIAKRYGVSRQSLDIYLFKWDCYVLPEDLER